MNSRVRAFALMIVAGALVGAAIAAVVMPSLNRWAAAGHKPAGTDDRSLKNATWQPIRSRTEVQPAGKERFDDYPKLIAAIKRASAAAEDIDAYTATLKKQVVTDGTLRDKEVIDLKVRRDPFSVSMKWRNSKQKVLYVAGENDGKLVARPPIPLPFRGALRLDPKSSLAMQGCRYPITEIGIHRLAERVSTFYRDRSGDHLTCKATHDTIDGHPVRGYEIRFENERTSPHYSKSQLLFDSASDLLIGIINYGWNEQGQPGELVEQYVYHNVDPGYSPSESDFSTESLAYGSSKQAVFALHAQSVGLGD